MATTREVLERGFPVTLRLCELPGFVGFVSAHNELSSRERAHLGDWLVSVDAEELESGQAPGSLFDDCLARTRDELEAWAPVLQAA